jgi:hypothetical protein
MVTTQLDDGRSAERKADDVRRNQLKCVDEPGQ